MKQTEHEITGVAEKLLKDRSIDIFLGYENGTLPLRTSPAFIFDPSKTRDLVWNSMCSNNLTAYIPRLLRPRPGKKPLRVGIVCKGCDSRSLNILIQEQQAKRDQLFIVGIACGGVIDAKKILSMIDQHAITAWGEDRNEIVLTTNEGEKRLAKNEFLYDSCRHCAAPAPTNYDVLIRGEQIVEQAAGPDPLVQDLLKKTSDERWKIFEHGISRCIRCYACRNACPNCYCNECFVEQTKPRWIGTSCRRSELLFFHMLRIFHQAGRCVDCGACVRACPMNIDLRPFTRWLVDDVKERYQYTPGISLDASPILASYDLDDKQEFMTEP